MLNVESHFLRSHRKDENIHCICLNEMCSPSFGVLQIWCGVRKSVENGNWESDEFEKAWAAERVAGHDGL